MPRRPPNVVPFPRRRWTRARDDGARRKGGGGAGPLLVMLPLAAFTVVFVLGGPPSGRALPFDAPAAAASDREAASFARCGGWGGDTCVIDGDTFRYRGEKIRIADINTPEVGKPGCAHEAALGARATDRLTALLNQGPFTLETPESLGDRDRDRYGRALRVVTRNGESLGAVLVDEGLAEEWQGYRRDWC